MVTKCSFRHNFTGTSNQKTYLTKVVKEYTLIKQMSCRPPNMESIGHKMFILSNLTGASKQKTYLAKVVKLGLLSKEMLSKPLNMLSFGYKKFISSQPYLCI